MPDSGAVYQPTTVGYSYDTGGAGGGFLGVGGTSRRKVPLKKWVEWALITAAMSALMTGLMTTLSDLASVNNPGADDTNYKDEDNAQGGTTTIATVITTVIPGQDQVEGEEESASGSPGGAIAAGAALMLAGLLLGLIWAWLRFFHQSKPPRNGASSGGGQYGPVLTELPTSQPKSKHPNNHQGVVVPLSDQEEETRTLMQEPPLPPANSSDITTTTTNQIAG